ncbi:MAG: tetratricopeptide repeat protein [Longimicrobiales bacterium]
MPLPPLRATAENIARMALAGLVISIAACGPAREETSSISRGDELAARGDLDEALAEYRLAAQLGSDDASTLARVAHTYAEMGRVDEAADFYRRTVAVEPDYADQAVADMVRLARTAAGRNDLFSVASAIGTAQEFRPGISVAELALPLARHHFRNGEYGVALPYYQKALAAMGEDPIPDIVFEAASAYDEVGDCRRALVLYEQYRRMIRRWQRGEVHWKIGSCSYRLAKDLIELDEDEAAFELIDRMITLGEPKNLLAVAYLDMGDVLARLGRCDEAMFAFQRVRDVDQTGSAALVERAQWRFDELRFSSPTRGIISGGGC